MRDFSAAAYASGSMQLQQNETPALVPLRLLLLLLLP